MLNRNYVRVFVLCLLPGLLCSVGTEAAGFGVKISSAKDPRTTTNRPWGNIGASKPARKYQPPPAIPGARYPGAAPGTGWYPAQINATGNQATEPVVEVKTSGTTSYEQQNIVYTVRVVSSDNLKTLTPVIPRIEGAILEQVDGPVASLRTSGRNGSLEIVNKYRFRLTPLRSGEIVIPAISFTGTHVPGRTSNGHPGMPDGGVAKRFSIAADSPLVLQVLPANPAVTPWLPLNDLRLRVYMNAVGPAKEGVPVTLTLELLARGALGSQLPSLEAQLKSDDFRAYRDSVSTRDSISLGGTEFRGARKETYTIIPLQDGWIQLPGIQVAWWDIDTKLPMLAGHSGQDAVTDAGVSRRAEVATGTAKFSAAFFWAPLLIFMGLVIGYWFGAWARTRPYLRAAGTWLSAKRQRFMQHTAVAGKKLSPARSLVKLRSGLARLLPGNVRLWLCARCIENEDKPDVWCNQFRSRICAHLDISRHAPITAIAEKIIELQPLAEPASLRALAQSMDNAVYGARPLDFAAWKKDFRRQLRPRLYRRRRSRLRHASKILPALNPYIA